MREDVLIDDSSLDHILLLNDDPQEKLNLYLVMKKIKPSTILINGPVRFLASEGKLKKAEEERRYCDKTAEWFLKKAGLCYAKVKGGTSIAGDSSYYDKVYPSVFMVGRDKDALDKLVNAETTDKIGEALGYPRKAIEKFVEKEKTGRLPGEEYKNKMIRYASKNHRIPDWLAYISFIPESVNSKSAKDLGTKYMKYVRENNPQLASLVEETFRTYFDCMVDEARKSEVVGGVDYKTCREPGRIDTRINTQAAY